MMSERDFMNDMRYLAGMDPLKEEKADGPIQIEGPYDSIKERIKAAEYAFLGGVAMLTRQYMRKQHRGVKIEVERMPAMGGGGSIGGVRAMGDNWQIDMVFSRKGDKWELWKRGTMSVGISKPIEMKDKVKLSDLHPESIAMAFNAWYGGLVEKNEAARQKAS
jgi:hypothetical protein